MEKRVASHFEWKSEDRKIPGGGINHNPVLFYCGIRREKKLLHCHRGFWARDMPERAGVDFLRPFLEQARAALNNAGEVFEDRERCLV